VHRDKVAGVILNKVTRDWHVDYSGYSYYGNYGYGSKGVGGKDEVTVSPDEFEGNGKG